MKTNKENQMFSIIEEMLTNNLTAVSVCRKYNITKDSLGYWKKKYNRLTQDKTNRFFPVEIPANKTIPYNFTIHYPNHVKIDIPSELDLCLLKKLINLY